MEKLQIRWKGCDKSPATENALKNALMPLEEKYSFLTDNGKAEIVAYKNDAKNPYKVRLSLFCTCKKTIRSEAASADILTAVNNCIKKADDQCRRIKVQKQNAVQDKAGSKIFSR